MIWDFNYTGNYLAFMFSILFADESKMVPVKSEYFHGIFLLDIFEDKFKIKSIKP